MGNAGSVLEAGPRHGDPGHSESADPGRLQVSVIYTTIAGTLAALNAAAALARNLNAEIVLRVAEIIYFRYPLENPPVSVGFFETLCLALIDELRLHQTETRIEIHFCRDQVQCLQLTLKPKSLVVIGSSGGWWNRRERKLESALRRLGHEPLLVRTSSDSQKSHAQSVVQRLVSQITGHTPL